MEMKDNSSALGTVLIKMGIISEDDLFEVLRLQHKVRNDTRLGSLLVEGGFCTEADIRNALSMQATLRSSDRAQSALEVADAVLKRKRRDSHVMQRKRIMDKADALYKHISDEYEMLPASGVESTDDDSDEGGS